MATEKQLTDRWFTPEGERVRQEIVEHIKEDNWERFLIGFPFVDEVENGRDLRFVNLNKANLQGASLARANLMGASLLMAYLSQANLQGANLAETILCLTNFIDANLSQANLQGANLAGADLTKTNFQGANLMEANLIKTDFWKADLQKANFQGASLARANLMEANLKGVKLNNTILQNSCLNQANLSSADLTGANVYGISAWDIITDENITMKNLIISKDPLITVDDIEIAQFIYMISNNKKIRNVIETMRTKGVLILGSFDNKTNPILEKLKEILKDNDLIPMVFHFEGSKELSLMDTVKTMALLSRFVIIDLSVRSGQYYEIAKLADNVKVPYATIAFEGTKTSSMLSDLNHYYWCTHDYFPYPQIGWEVALPALIKDTVIPWANGVNKKLRKNNDR